MDVIQSLGSFASIIALGITVWVAFRLWRIEKSYIRQALLPSHVRKLGGHIKNLEEALRAKNPQLARNQLAVCHSNLQDLSAHLTAQRLHRARELARAIDGLRRSHCDDTLLEECEKLVGDLHGMLESLKFFETELRWRIRDVK